MTDNVKKEEIAGTPAKVGIKSRIRSTEEVEELRRKYLEGLSWEGSTLLRER